MKKFKIMESKKIETTENPALNKGAVMRSAADFKEEILKKLTHFYEYSDEYGYSNAELSRIRSCITKVKETPLESFNQMKRESEVNKISSDLLISRSVAEFAYKISVAMESIASSNVFFMMQQAYTEDVMYDYRLCQEKWKAIQDELRQHFR